MNAILQVPADQDALVEHDPIALRHVLGRFATGVAVVTTQTADGIPVGLTVNSISSVSLAPPLISWCLRRDAASYAVFAAASHWAISVLARDQLVVARRFCSPQADRFAGVAHRLGIGGAPLIDGAIAQLECAAFSSIDGGDHRIFLGKIVKHATAEGAPLLFHGGNFGDWSPWIA